MIEKLKELWKWHGPILMTRSKVFSLLVSQEVELDKINNKIARAAICPVIFSLEELKKNTWDKDRVEYSKIIDAEFEELDTPPNPKERIFPLTAFLMGFNLALVLMFIGRM